MTTASSFLPNIIQARPEQKPYQPFGSALELFYSRDDEVIVDGPAGTGKSRAALEKMNLLAMKYPDSRHLMVRKTRESLTQSAMVTFDKWVIPNNGSVHWRTTEQEYRYSNGAVIVVGGLDKSSKIMSTEYDTIYIQEVTELTEGEYEDLTTRARNGAMPYNQVVSDCNPTTSRHWVKRRWEDGKAKRIKSIHRDNPRIYDQVTGELTKFGKSYMRKLQSLTGLRKKRLCDGEWVSAEGLVYEEWDHTVHVIPRYEIPRDWRKFCSVDFGYTNPFVCQWWAMDPDDRMILYRQIYMTKRTVRAHAETIRELSDKDGYIEVYVCDWDAEDRATLEENGFYTVGADKAVSVGIEKVKERLKLAGDGKPRLYIMEGSLVEVDPDLEDAYKPICTEQEFDDYTWSDKKTKEMPVKVGDHGMDTTRYAVMYNESYRPNGGVWV